MIYLFFTICRIDIMSMDTVFITGKILELTCDDRSCNDVEQLSLVIYILILFLNTEYGSLAGTVA